MCSLTWEDVRIDPMSHMFECRQEYYLRPLVSLASAPLNLVIDLSCGLCFFVSGRDFGKVVVSQMETRLVLKLPYIQIVSDMPASIILLERDLWKIWFSGRAPYSILRYRMDPECRLSSKEV